MRIVGATAPRAVGEDGEMQLGGMLVGQATSIPL